MNTDSPAPPGVRLALHEILLATETLVEAAAAEDAEAIERALERRTCAIERLESRRSRPRAEARAADDPRLHEDWNRIEARTTEAFARLGRMRNRARAEIELLLRGSEAVRSYAGDESGARVLDRSG